MLMDFLLRIKDAALAFWIRVWMGWGRNVFAKFCERLIKVDVCRADSDEHFSEVHEIFTECQQISENVMEILSNVRTFMNSARLGRERRAFFVFRARPIRRIFPKRPKLLGRKIHAEN